MDQNLSLVSEQWKIDSTTAQEYLIFINDNSNYNRSGKPINKDWFDYSFMTKSNIKGAFEDIKKIIARKIANIIDKKTTGITTKSIQFIDWVFNITIEVSKKDNQDNILIYSVKLKDNWYEILVTSKDPEKLAIIYFDRKVYSKLDDDINSAVSHIKDQYK